MKLKDCDNDMQKMIIQGGNKLSGTITINGAKNSAVALLPAAILSGGKTVITNVPDITDVEVLSEIIKQLNGTITKEKNRVIIDSSQIMNNPISKDLSSKLRASYYFMGALLAKFNYVEIYYPGGCNFGARQIDYHLKGFEALGAKVNMEQEKFIITAKELKGAQIKLPFPSVGATINLMLAATKAHGKTVIYNAAKEPEIKNVADFLNKMGANITGAGSDTIEILGVTELHEAIIEVIPDRIEAGTYIIAGALMGKNLTIKNVNIKHLKAFLNTLEQMEIPFSVGKNEITISEAKEIKPIDIETKVYPGFPTDLAQPICVLLLKAQGISHVKENIYHKRLGHVKYLNKMGANIIIDDFTEKIIGPVELHGTEVEASDLRAGATLFLAALISKEKTIISNVEYILRGYEKIVRKLSSVGANIRIETIK